MKKITTLLLLTIGLTGWFPQRASAQEVQVLTLEKALEIAYRNSPTLIKSKITLEQNELSLVRQKAMLKSKFTLNLSPFSYRRQNNYSDYESKNYTSRTMTSQGSLRIDQPIIWTGGSISLSEGLNWQDASNQSQGGNSTSFYNELALTLTQPIFKYNELKMQLKEIEYQVEESKISNAITQLNIETSVTNDFYSVYKSYKSLLNQQENYKQVKATYEMTKAQVEQDKRPKVDLLEAEVNLDNAEMSLANAQIEYESTKDNFKKLLGLSLDEDISVLPQTEFDSVHVDMNLAIKYALEQRMEIRQHNIAIEKGLLELIKTKAQDKFSGEISATVGLWNNSSNFTGAFQDLQDKQDINLNVSIPIFDWGARKASIRSTELSNESNEIDLTEERKGIIIAIRQICRSLPQLYKEIFIAKKSLENTEILYDIKYQKYQSGEVSNKDLQDYQKNVTNAKETYTNTIIQYKQKLLELKINTLWDFETNTSYLPVNLLK
ncbi:TolC family protein [uncultured Sanguibacteroides sp.]|uniref:TolC family protein n=1 Tax=uncultured Sanguibacteroides sp. TaxID=1635151 RepID=UPI0025E4F647|nr:TolC family protein [uncultured Sanguibacteroides sp.]